MISSRLVHHIREVNKNKQKLGYIKTIGLHWTNTPTPPAPVPLHKPRPT